MINVLRSLESSIMSEFCSLPRNCVVPEYVVPIAPNRESEFANCAVLLMIPRISPVNETLRSVTVPLLPGGFLGS